MRNRTKNQLILIVITFLLVIVQNQDFIRPTKAITNIYIENFTSTSYRDVGNSNVTGWGTGEVSLPRFAPYQLSRYDNNGFAYGIDVQGDLAFIAHGWGDFRIVNISDLNNPSLISTIPVGNNPKDVFVDGNIAYVTVETSDVGLTDKGLYAVDISDPKNPVVVGHHDITTTRYVEDVIVKGNIAYFATFDGLKIIDVSDPTNLNEIGNIYNGWVWDVDVVGNYAYFVTGGGSTGTFQVIDVSDPANPILVTSQSLPNVGFGIDVIGGMAYIAYRNGFQIRNVENPNNPFVVRTMGVSTSYPFLSITKEGNFLYLGNSDGVRVYDIFSPTSPLYMGLIGCTDAYELIIEGNQLFIADFDAGLRIIQIFEETQPKLTGSIATLGNAIDVAVEGNYAYVAAADSGLRILSIDDPTNPVEVSNYIRPGNPRVDYITIDGEICFTGGEEFAAYNISDPNDPAFLGAYSPTGEISSMNIAGNLVYLGSNNNLIVLNITDPTNPASIGTGLTLPAYIENLVVDGNYLYVADGNSGLQVVDISNPLIPVIIGTWAGFFAFDISITGDLAYIAGGGGLVVMNISNPNIPTIKGYYDSPGESQGIQIAGNTAHLVTGNEGIYVKLNITDPSTPTLVDSYNYGGSANGLTIEGNYVFIADSEYGLWIVETRMNIYQKRKPFASAQSTSIPLEAGNFSLVDVEIIYKATIPENCSITLFISCDIGLSWIQVNNNSVYSFNNYTYNLRWRAYFTSLDHTKNPTTTPYLHSVTLSYSTELLKTSPISPRNNYITRES